MSDQEINIAIAEACGWKFDDSMEMWLSPNDIHFFPWQLPDYCNDLNAMHEAEGTLTKQQQEEYDYQLSEITAPITGERWSLLHANARQRAEAFLRTIGKWEEDAK